LAHEDLNKLLNALVPFAQKMLAKHGEFFPFGGYMDIGGGIAHVGGWTGDEQPRSQEVIGVMVKGLHQQAERQEIRAAAICLDVRTTPEEEVMKRQSQFPPGWDEARVRRVHEHYEAQTDEEALAEDEASFEATTHTAMEVPIELVPAVRELLAKHKHSA
jgi:hypothetical protein